MDSLLIKERRSSKRIKAVFPITVRENNRSYFKQTIPLWGGETVNISDSGAGIITERPFPIGSQLKLKIEIPADYSLINNHIGSIRTDANVIWIVSDQHSGGYRCGVRFLNPHDDSIRVLKKNIDLEQNRLAQREWTATHPKISLPTLPPDHKLLESLSPSALSVDVTNLCNLKCKHCFWDSYKNHLKNDTNKDVLDSVKTILDRFPSITNITWYGGEPLLNRQTRNIVKEGIKLRKNNLLITNGTLSIPDWNGNIHIGVSIDGTREMHNKLRNSEIYDIIKKNILAALKKNIPVGILYCVNALNIDCIPAFLNEWADEGLIEIVFTTYVPLKDKPSLFSLTDEQRDKTVSVLLAMKAKYGNLISNTELMIELIRAKYSRELAANCSMNVFNSYQNVLCFHLCNDGTVRVPCAIGPNADHLQCRSVTKLALYAGKILHDRTSLLALLKMYHSKPHSRKNACLDQRELAAA